MARARPPPPPPVDVRLGGIARYDLMPPRGPYGLRRWFWKKGVQIDAHLSFAMLEWWEALIVAILVLPITGLFWYSAFTYFPSHFSYLSRRFSYYVFGDENSSVLDAIVEWLNILWMSVRGAPQVPAAVSVASVGSVAGKVDL